MEKLKVSRLICPMSCLFADQPAFAKGEPLTHYPAPNVQIKARNPFKKLIDRQLIGVERVRRPEARLAARLAVFKSFEMPRGDVFDFSGIVHIDCFDESVSVRIFRFGKQGMQMFADADSALCRQNFRSADG